MSTRVARALAAALPWLVAPALAAEPVPLQAFFGPPELGTVALSPGGRWLAITAPGKGDRMELRVADLDEPQPWKWRTVAWLKDYDIASVSWVSERRLVFEAWDSQAPDVWSGTRGLWAVDTDGENGKLLIDAEYGGYHIRTTRDRYVLPGEWELERVLPGDGEDVLVRQWRWSSLRGVLYYGLARINTRAPEIKMLSTGAPDGAQRWITDREGQPRYLQSWWEGRDRVHRKSADGTWQELASFEDLDDGAWEPRFLVGDKLLVSTQPQGASARVLTTLDPVTGKPAEKVVLGARGFDVGDTASPVLDEESGAFLGWRYALDTLYSRWEDPRMSAFQAGIDRALPGRVNRISCGRCSSSKRWLVRSFSDRDPGQFALFEPGSGRLAPLGSARPEIPPERMGSRTLERVKARDGLELPVYLTRPAGIPAAPEKPLPAVVYVHGGPWSRTHLHWSTVPQFLASRGYLVIEPDFRASTGYGLAHERAGRGQWGRAMQDDLSDALRWAVQRGLADGERVCIMGASYGGYAALLGPAHDPTAYRCAISWVGVTDLPRLLAHDTEDDWWFRGLLGRLMRRNVGDPEKDARKLEQTSPVYRAGEIKVPVLAAWGMEDRRVPLEQGRRFRDAAKRAGVELEYVEYAGEGHSWLRAETRLDFFRRAERLLERTLGPKGKK